MADANLLQISEASKGFGAKTLFENAAFSVNESEHIGLIGPNGAGKTTLIKVIAGLEKFDSGTIVKSRSLRIGYLEQEADWATEETVEESLASRCSMAMWDIKKNGRELGLSEDFFARTLKSLSGGYRMRVKLLSLIGQEPNLLLLDEPTNFLDLETVLVLENFLQGYRGAFLLISHDREFLRRVTDHIVEVEGGEITKYPGTIDDYFEQKALIREQLQKAAASQAAKKAMVMDFVNRFGAKATKARQAQSRLRTLDRMETIEIKPIPVRARIPIPSPVKAGKEVVRVQKLACGYAETPILKNIELTMNRGTHLGIVGLNGAGKSTLLKTLAGQLPAMHGQVQLGLNVNVALFSQHSAEQLKGSQTVFEALSDAAHPETLRQEILNLAGGLLFSGDAMEKKISVLSGGEKARVALGQVLLSKANLLLLDEPTNHLDFDTVEALTMALAAYEGSLIVVSHDRGFISRIANQILEVDRGQVSVFPGTYDDYVWSLQKGVLSEARSMAQSSQATRDERPTKGSGDEAPRPGQRLKQIESELRKGERQLAALEKKLLNLTGDRDRLTSQLNETTGPQIAQLAIQMHEKSQEISILEEEVLQLMESVQALESERTQLK